MKTHSSHTGQELLLPAFIKRSRQYVKKDYVHTFFTGLVLFIITNVVGFFSENGEQKKIFFILSCVFFLLLGIRAWYERRAGFYLVKASSRTKYSVPYLRKIGGHSYYYSFAPETFYKCYLNGSFTKLGIGGAMEYKTDPRFYSDLGDEGDIYLLLSPTQTLLGCFTADGGFVKNY